MVGFQRVVSALSKAKGGNMKKGMKYIISYRKFKDYCMFFDLSDFRCHFIEHDGKAVACKEKLCPCLNNLKPANEGE